MGGQSGDGFPFFASDNEELWELEPCARLDFDPIALHDELLEKQRALPETKRERLSVSLVALLDHGWAAQLGELLICVDGPPELAENIEHTIVVTDELRGPPFLVL